MKLRSCKGFLVTLAIILTAVCVTFSSLGTAQAGKKQEFESEKVIRGNFDSNLQVLPLKNEEYILYGKDSYYSENTQLWKVDKNGKSIWKEVYKGLNIWIKQLSQTSDGGFLFGGGNEYGIKVVKTNEKGKIKWEYSFEGQCKSYSLTTMLEKRDGYEITLINYCNKTIDFLYLDKNGSLKDIKTYKNENLAYIESLIVTKDEKYVVTDGYSVIQLNGNLKNIWSKHLPSERKIGFSHLLATKDNGFIVSFGKEVDSNDYAVNIKMIKYSSNGENQWESVRPSSQVYTIQEMENGSYVVMTTKNGLQIYGVNAKGKTVFELTKQKEPFTSYQPIHVSQLPDNSYQIFAFEDSNLYLAKVRPLQSPAEALKIIVNRESVQITKLGSPIALKAYLVYEDGTKQDMTDKAYWESSNSRIAQVSKGKITAQNYGITTISVNSEDFSATVKVEVAPPSIAFMKSFGKEKTSEEGSVVVALKDGNYVVAGTKYSDNGYTNEGYVAKIDSKGKLLWDKNYCYERKEECIESGFKHAIQTSDDGLLLLGGTDRNLYLLKTDAKGKVEWQYGSAGKGGISLLEFDKGYLVVGFSELHMFDRKGKVIWEKELENTYYRSAAKGGKNTVTVTGDGLLTSIDAMGTIIWEKKFEGYGTFYPLSNGNYVAVSGTNNKDDTKILIVDGNGAKKIEKKLPANDRIVKVIPMTNDGFAILEQDDYEKAMLTLYDNSGKKKKQAEFQHGDQGIQLNAGTQTKDGGVILTGMIEGLTVNHTLMTDMLVMKVILR